MRNIILLSFLFTYQNIFAVIDHNLDNFFCVSNRVLKILPLENDDIIFYGTEGGVLRNINHGEEWIQNYSGTKSSIVDMIQNEGRVIGVTFNGNVMTSDDNGNWWKYQKLADTLIGIIALDDLVIVASKTDSLFFSSDNGLTWSSKKLDFSNIVAISTFEGKIIINTKSFNIFISSNKGNSWEELPYPFKYNRVNKRNGKYCISNNYTIAILNPDLTWETTYLSTMSSYLAYIIEENSLITFTEEFRDPNYDFPKLKVYKYDLEKNSSTLVKVYEDPALGSGIPACLTFAPYDVCKIDDMYYLTTDFKTILKSTDLINWEVVSSASTRPFVSKFNSDRWEIYLQYSTGALYSYNKGATFKYSNAFYVEKDEKKYLSTIEGSCELKNGEIFYVLNSSMRESGMYPKDVTKIFAKSYDGGKTIVSLSDTMPKLFRSECNFNFLGFNKNKCYIDQSYEILAQFPSYKDSTYKHIFMTYDMEKETIDTLFVRDMNVNFGFFFFDEDKIWLYGQNKINYEVNEIHLSTDGGKNFKLVATPPISGDILSMKKSKNGRYFLITINGVFELDTNDYSYKNVNFGYELINIDFYSEIVGDGYFEEQYYFVYTKITDTLYDAYIVKFSVEDSILMKKVIKIESTLIPIRNKADDYLIYYKNTGANFNMYIPIEPERLSYYTSVESTESRNYLWTNPPYPQPTNSQVKVKVYWDSELPFTSDDVEIYDLTGTKLNTDGQINVIKENNWQGNIIWDASNQNPGIYLMKITHGTETRTRKILITE